MTDIERKDALRFLQFWLDMRAGPLKSFIAMFIGGGFGVGILTVGVVHFIIGSFFDIPQPAKSWIVVSIAFAGAVWLGFQHARHTIASNQAIAHIERMVIQAMERAEVCVHTSESVKSYFNHEENSEHPPLVIDFGDGDTLALESMDQDIFGINEEVSGECEIVRLPDSGVLSVKTTAGTKHLSKLSAG